MATFKLKPSSPVPGTAYKFYIRNRSKVIGLYYDIGLITQGSEVDWKSGTPRGIVRIGGSMICSFDLKRSKQQIANPQTAMPQMLEEPSLSLFNVHNTPLSLRFWRSGMEQHINLLKDGPVGVLRDEPTFNEAIFHRFQFTLSCDEHDNDTQNIYCQLNDY
ncbi:hypothetical protein ACIP1T_21890 [Pseudomonas japonica]|uniref:hypothetical protein n=1 Tax=Pseudomonas japonica TaxID=256466 RepID=UPI0038060490